MRFIVIAGKADQWYGVDFDGTLAKYDRYRGPDHCGEPVKKMVDRVKRWLADGKTVKVFTARVSGGGADAKKARKAIQDWCEEHVGERLEVVCEKDQHMVELWDDRAVRVEQNTGKRVAMRVVEVVR